MKRFAELDVIIPISLDLDWPEDADIIKEIKEQHERYGFTRFALACPCGGWRSVGYPPTAFFAERAARFKGIRDTLAADGIECGWWITATVKSGVDESFEPYIRADGTRHPMANCALDPAFRQRFAADVAVFAKIAKPAFIITEDDYSVHAASPAHGCFCKHHLAEFARREGVTYTREALLARFGERTQEGYALLRRWRALAKDALVLLAKEIRHAVDACSPEIPIGCMQSGCCDLDGDATEAICRALAGPRHTPFSRLYGTFYGTMTPEALPPRLFHALYSRQHITGDFIYYHESDTFPHTRFFLSGRDMMAVMASVYSMGFDGSTFQTQQLLDHANEEHAFGDAFRAERVRFNALYRAVKHCTLRGAKICYDPFFHNVEKKNDTPVWTRVLGMMGLPFTTTDADIVFLDRVQAAFEDDEALRAYLAKPLVFIDGDAAEILTARGFAPYLGVAVGGPVNDTVGNELLRYDLGAREVITPAFREEGKGTNMPSAHMFAPANGVMHEMHGISEGCAVVTELYGYDRRLITPAMTVFQNSLGGTAVVMAISVEKNYSQSLYNYRRQRLLHRLIMTHCDTLAFVREAPLVFPIMNEANDPAAAGFSAILTLINLSSDALGGAALHLPPAWRGAKEYRYLTAEGTWVPLPHEKTADGIRLLVALDYLKPLYLMVV